MKPPSISIFILAIAVFVFLSNPALLQAQQEQQEQTAPGFCRLKSDQNLWSGPSRNYKVVRKAKAGLLLKIIGEKQGHYRVQVPDGFKCYVYADFLEVNDQGMGTTRAKSAAATAPETSNHTRW